MDMFTGDGWAISPDGSRRWGTLGAAGLFLLTPDRRVLMQHRAKWTNRGGTWALPGGAIDVGETPAEGALRETWEETGVVASDVTILSELITARQPVSVTKCRRPVLPEDMPMFGHIDRIVERTGDPVTALQDNPVIHPDHGSRGVFGLGARYWWEFNNPEITEWTYTTVLATCTHALELNPTAESLELEWWPLDELEKLPLMPEFAASLPEIREALDQLLDQLQ
ncbi:NUDIX domain-containing protein [Corynebacterium falsenii]|uniref:NUDIX domain-containing protein n=1 Tax=Corynebacterium falsenii TaxID=108486 RepID=UPI003FD5336A